MFKTTANKEHDNPILAIKLRSPSSTGATMNKTNSSGYPTMPTTLTTTTPNLFSSVSTAAGKPGKLPDKQSYGYKQEASFLMYLAAFSSLLGAFSFGLGIGWSSPAFEQFTYNTSVPQLCEPYDLSLLTWIGSALPLTALFGAAFSDSVVQRFGRRIAMIGYCIPLTIGWLLIIVAQSGSVILTGRIVLGLAIGALSGTVPGYVNDISTIRIRGTLGALFQLFIVTGILFAYVIGAFLTWRMASIVSLTPTILQAILLYFMPEGPNWLIQRKRLDQAKRSLIRVRSPNSEIDKEFDILVQESEQLSKLEKGSIDTVGSLGDDKEKQKQKQTKNGSKWHLYKKKENLVPLILSLGLMSFQQFSGVNVVMFYATPILHEAGSSITPSLGTILIGLAQWLATFASAVLVDLIGRRSLLLISGVVHVISMLLFGVYYHFLQEKETLGWIPVFSMVIFIIGFAVGWGPIPWLMVAEITPRETSSLTAACSTTVNWALAFIVTKTFKELQELLTQHGVFYLFSALSAASVLFTLFCLPETKNKTYEQIQDFFAGKKSSGSKTKDGSIGTTGKTSKTNTKPSFLEFSLKDSNSLTRSSDSA